MHDDSELRDRLLTVFGPGPQRVTADEVMYKVTERPAMQNPKWSTRMSRVPRRTTFAWLGGVLALIVALVFGFGAGFRSSHTPIAPIGSGGGWHQVTFGGLHLSVPVSWPVQSEDAWGECGPAGSPYFKSSTVVLDTGVQPEVFHCPSYTPSTLIAPTYGIVVDPGSYGPLRGQSIGTCRAQAGLRICPSVDYGGIEVFAVFILGRSQPVAIEVGLAGSGRVAQTILDSLRPLAASPPTTTTTRTSTITTTPKQTLPALNPDRLPVPTDYTCSTGLYGLSPANEAAGECVPYAFLVGGTASSPSNDTACPAGSFMTMGPVECSNNNGIVSAVPPGPNTCSTPGGPCPSSTLTLSPQTSVIPWSAIEFPTGKCPAAYYFGETNGIATCVPYDYLPGGTSTNPNKNTACPSGSRFKILKLTGTLCTQDAEPYDIVAPIPRQT
jgi:hypothetical protein